jgi:hypothetical protein
MQVAGCAQVRHRIRIDRHTAVALIGCCCFNLFTGVKLEDLERQKLEEVISVARKSQAPALAAAAAAQAAQH